jgi:hypothetical protein
MPLAQINDFYFTSWDGDQLEPASRQVAVLDPPPGVHGRGYLIGGLQAPFADPIITEVDAGLTRELAENLARQYRLLKNAAAGVTVWNSIGTRYDDVMVVEVRCFVHLNTATGQWRVRASWQLDVGADES